ncbi:hypothetical protein C2G38_2203378 [Gigaspora rosea]|uniref:Uncharacterized protein n=1 Tax=Gigaspora rosea TaxID=44941 RepID=A0A397UMS4_9GLOM|nr:hypothetical protein C2G38_2203378 [Gigaspora rosea]
MAVRANTMVRKTRSNKKDTICKCCSHKCSTPQKLCEHLKRKNLCKPLQDQKYPKADSSTIQEPVQKVVKTTSKDISFKNPNIK